MMASASEPAAATDVRPRGGAPPCEKEDNDARLQMRIDVLEALLANSISPSLSADHLGALPVEPALGRALSESGNTTMTTAAPFCVADDDAEAEAVLGYNCQTLTAMGYCHAYLCWDCAYPGLCDTSCALCCDDYDDDFNDDSDDTFVGTNDCATLASQGFCETHFCADGCPYPFRCDLSCGFCPVAAPTAPPNVVAFASPTPAPTTTAPSALGCIDYDVEVSANSGGFDCATLATMDYCASTFCPTCSSTGYCDLACGYCPTPAPTTAPCVDYDAEVSASSGGFDCATLASMGYCGSEFCPTCSSSGYCDAACSYCSKNSDSENQPSLSPTTSPVPTTTPRPTPEATTPNPTSVPIPSPTPGPTPVPTTPSPRQRLPRPRRTRPR